MSGQKAKKIEESDYLWFQFRKELKLPIFIRIKAANFDQATLDFLASQHFSKVLDAEQKEAVKLIAEKKEARVLTINEANLAVARQITNVLESDRFGMESIVHGGGYRVYRYKGEGLMVYSFQSKEWQLGVFKTFGDKSSEVSSKIMINRFLSFALQSLGIVGFWGVPIEGGVVVQKYKDSRGEAVFVDLANERILTLDGVKKIRSQFKVLRLDPTLKNKNIRMTGEELLSFLSAHCSYFDTQGLTVPVRQMIQEVSRVGEGLIHPEESFKPRTDLSL